MYFLVTERALLRVTASLLLSGLMVNFVPVPPVFCRHGVVAFSGISVWATVWTATPGPLIILGFLTSGRSATEARALVQPVAFFAYGSAFLLHAASSGLAFFSAGGVEALIVAAIAGGMLGRFAGKHLPQKLIKTAICAISAAACVALVRQAYLLG